MSVQLPKFEQYEMASQIRRSVKSIKSNIVEGYGRRRYKLEFIRFLVIAHASCDETIDHLETLFETHSFKNENLYDINILMYVLLHELSHLCNYNQYNEAIIGHGTEFRNIFSLLTQESINIGVYRYENYKNNPQEYCGLIINSNIL